MGRVLTLFCTVLLIFLGMWWYWAQDTEEVAPTDSSLEVTNEQKSEAPVITTRREKVQEQEVTLIVPNEKVLEAEIEEQIDHTVPMRQWAYDLSAFALHIGKLNAIEQGQFSVEEGEEPPDLHEEYKEINKAYDLLPFDQVSEDFEPAFLEVKGLADSIVQEISDPPTTEELLEANKKRRELQQQANSLYVLF